MAINFLALANKGRFGDTKLRKVKGKVSHVNPVEAEAIDSLGQLGESLVQNTGSGTINPQTGFPEYHLWHDHGAHTSFGKFLESSESALSGGDFKSVKERNKEIDNKNKYGGQYGESGGKQFYTDRLNKVLYENIAGLTSTALETGQGLVEGEEDLEGTVPKYDTYDDFLKSMRLKSGSTDYNTFAPRYDMAEEQKLLDDVDRLDDEWNLEFGAAGDDGRVEGLNTSTGKSNEMIKQEAFDNSITALNTDKSEAFAAADSANKRTGSDLSASLFGQLTTANQKSATSNFAGAGDFGAEFAEGQLMNKAGAAFDDTSAALDTAIGTADEGLADIGLAQEEAENMKVKAAGVLAGEKANIIQQVRGLHDKYNKAFHEQANTWITNKFG